MALFSKKQAKEEVKSPAKAPKKKKKFKFRTAPKKQEANQPLFLIDEDKTKTSSFKDNVRTLNDAFAPSQIDVIDSSTLKVGDTYVRNYVMQGYPSFVRVGWLDRLYNYNGDMDTTLLIVPSEDRSAIEELTSQITATEAQLQSELKKGQTNNAIAYQDKIHMLEEQRRKIELNYESMFDVGLFANLTARTKEDLDRQAEILEADLKGRRANLLPTAYRMLSGYKTALPLNENFFEDKLRNFTTGSVVACMPFIRGEICHPDGVYLGYNEYTGNNVMIDFYDKHMINNTNVSVFGRAGSGKTFLVSLLTLRSALKGIYTAIIDPEGEYSGVTNAIGGSVIELSPGSNLMINPFDVAEEEEMDNNDKLTGRRTVNLQEKYGDLLDLICVMAVDVDQEQKSLISSIIVKLYQTFGITTDPNSLYDASIKSNPKTGEIYPYGKPKRMPQFTDFYNLLAAEIDRKTANNPNDPEALALRRMQNKLKMYLQGEAYPLFDCQSTVNLEKIKNSPLVSFDVSKLEESTLRPIGMYVCMSYIWDKIVKSNYQTRKRVVADEAWMMLNEGYPGHEYTAQFLEKCARRIRKRNAGLLVSSQNFIEFANCTQGQAVLNQTAVKMFLKQNETDIDALQDKFKISDGERNFLLQSKTGEVLIKTDTDSAVCKVEAFPIESEIIKNSRVF